MGWPLAKFCTGINQFLLTLEKSAFVWQIFHEGRRVAIYVPYFKLRQDMTPGVHIYNSSQVSGYQLLPCCLILVTGSGRIRIKYIPH